MKWKKVWWNYRVFNKDNKEVGSNGYFDSEDEAKEEADCVIDQLGKSYHYVVERNDFIFKYGE